ncbi:MAG: acyl-CoA thioesterase [Microthrixaceae bacterium]
MAEGDLPDRDVPEGDVPEGDVPEGDVPEGDVADAAGAGIDVLVDALDLEPVGDGGFRGTNADITGSGVVFGGQLMAQSIIAGASIDPDKAVKSLQVVFAKGAAPDAPLEIDVQTLAVGRAFSSAAVTISQGERICTHAIVLLSAIEPDLIRHQDPMPTVQGPGESREASHGGAFWQIRNVDGVDIADPSAVGPAELAVWTRFEGAPDAASQQTLNRALLAFATDGFLIGTAMRPHEGVGQSMAHVSISTTVNAHSISFHEDVDAGSWMLLDQQSRYAGHGRSHGTGRVFDGDGQLVATFSQDNMVRDFPKGTAPEAGGRAKH